MRASAAERESEVLQASTVAEAAERLTETGYVVLRDPGDAWTPAG